MRLPKSLMFVVAVLLLTLPRIGAELTPPTNDEPAPQIDQPKGPPEPFEKEQQRTMEKARNEGRQKELKRDTVRLLELATELKQYVDRTNESVLSVEVIRKAEEIERLAKSVKNKMKGP